MIIYEVKIIIVRNYSLFEFSCQKSPTSRSCTSMECFNLITQCIVANIVGDEIIGKTIV